MVFFFFYLYWHAWIYMFTLEPQRLQMWLLILNKYLESNNFIRYRYRYLLISLIIDIQVCKYIKKFNKINYSIKYTITRNRVLNKIDYDYHHIEPSQSNILFVD